jgi:hypothetical protein
MVYVNIFWPIVMNWIFDKEDAFLVVNKNDNYFLPLEIKFNKECLQLHGFVGSSQRWHVLCFCSWK